MKRRREEPFQEDREDEEELEYLTKKALQSKLRNLNLPISGNKRDLIKRLKTQYEQSSFENDIKDEKNKKKKTSPKNICRDLRRRRSGGTSFVASHSTWTWNDVRQKFGICSENIDDDENFFIKYKENDKLNELVEGVLADWKTKEKAYNSIVFNAWSEDIRVDFVLSIIIKIVTSFTSNLKVTLEHAVNGNSSWGPVDIVLLTKSVMDLPILKVVEMKKENMLKGKAQLYMQLHQISKKNLSIGAKFPIYGILSSGATHCFVRYDPELYDPEKKVQHRNLFVESSVICTPSSCQETEMKQLLSIMTGILIYLDTVATAFV